MVRRTAPAPAPAAVSATTDVAAVTEKAPPVVKKTKKTKEVVPLETMVTETAPVVAVVESVASMEGGAPAVKFDSTVVDNNSMCLSKMVEFSAKLQTLSSQLSAIRTEFKMLEKHVVKEIKRKSRGKKKLSGDRRPSGFIKPTKITNELAEFLGVQVGIEMARTEVSREINNYIKQHKLEDPENGRNINPDKKLSNLLKLEKDDKLTYFNLQKYMKHHFLKESDIGVSSSV
jgi:chromatin remodeling complex protein RSC6